MKSLLKTTLCLAALFSVNAWGQDSVPSALECSDFRPTAAALERYPDLVGACEAVVERNGNLFGQFSAVVRRATTRSVTLYLPVTDHTFTVTPKSDARVLIDGRKVRSRDLMRGQKIQIYLSTDAFSTPNIEEVALATDTTMIIEHPVEPAAALPTTASPWPALALLSLSLLGGGLLLRQRRTTAASNGS